MPQAKEEKFFRFDISETEMKELLAAISFAYDEGQSKSPENYNSLANALLQGPEIRK